MLDGAVAGYLGAKHGPGIIRRALDAGRTWRAVLVFAINVPMTLLWICAATYGMVLGSGVVVAVFALPAMAGVALIADAAGRWAFAPRADAGPVLMPAPSGLPATAWQRSPLAMIRPLAVNIGFVVSGGAVFATWYVWDLSDWWWVVIGLFLISPIIHLWMSRHGVLVGGLYLTAAGIEHVWGPAYSKIPWDSVHLGTRLTLDRSGAERVRAGESWGTDPTDNEPTLAGFRRFLPIPTAYLTDRPDTILAFIEYFARDANARSRLGRITKLDWTQR